MNHQKGLKLNTQGDIEQKDVASFDLDGVINMENFPGVWPGKDDIIITGRSYEEEHETMIWLARRGITNPVYFNPRPFDEKTRETSGEHKARVMQNLAKDYPHKKIVIHYEDDPIQAEVIKKYCPNIQVVLLVHELVEKENVRRDV